MSMRQDTRGSAIDAYQHEKRLAPLGAERDARYFSMDPIVIL